MTQQDRPKLELGEPPGRLKEPGRTRGRSWIALILVLQLAILVLLLLRADGKSGSPSTAAGTDPEHLKQAALALEDRSLYEQAAETWEAYLRVSPEEANRPQLLYRTGKLYMQARQFDKAVIPLVRAELLSGEDAELKSKLNPRMIECLRKLGMYGEVGRELSRRVAVGGDEAAERKVLASFAGEALTEADLDRMIERRVDQMLALQGAAVGETQRRALLEQLSTPQARQQLLQELLQTELFSRRARELNLDREPEFQEARAMLEQNLLASRFLQQELAAIRATPVDLETFYQANLQQYREPEAARIVLLRLEAEEDAQALLAGLESAEDFRQLARERAATEGGDSEAPIEETIARGRFHASLGYETDTIFEGLAEGEWLKEPITYRDARCLVLLEGKTPERTPELSEVQDRVRSDYLQRKQQELAEQLSRDLMARYDVRIIPPEEEDAPEAASEN